MASKVMPQGRVLRSVGHAIVVGMVQVRAEITQPIIPPALRLRSMVESWERQCLIAPGVAAPLLRPDTCALEQMARPPHRIRLLEGPGYVGAAIVLAAGILLTNGGGTGPLLLAGSLVMVAVRPNRPRARRPSAPRHRAHPPRAHRAARARPALRPFSFSFNHEADHECHREESP